MNPAYVTDDVMLYHGDCLDVLPLLAPGSVDAIVTSPPYNQLGSRAPAVGSGLMSGSGWLAKVAAKGYADDMTEADYSAWLANVAASLATVARPGASLFFNHKVRYRDGEAIHPIDYVRAWPEWKFRQEIVWDRACAIAFNCGLFAPSDERIYWLVKPGEKWGWNAGAASMLSVWRISSNRHINSSVKGHPCPFPLEIPTRCIAAVTSPGDTVLDCFAGSGTTLIAALKAGRKAIGIESDPQYIPTIIRRLREAETPLFAGGVR